MSGGLVTSCPITCAFFRLTVSPKSLQAELERLITYCSSSLECGALLTNLGRLGFQSGNVEESSIRSLSKVSSFSWRSKDVFSIMVKRVPNKVWARTHPCFTPLGILKVSEDEPSKTTLSFISSWKDLIILRRFGGQPIFRSILKSPGFTRSKVRSMNEMHSDCLCSLQFSRNFLMENILSIVDCLALKPHCDSR